MKRIVLFGIALSIFSLCQAKQVKETLKDENALAKAEALKSPMVACTSTATTVTTTYKDGTKKVENKVVTTCDTPEEMARFIKAMQ